ncbi:MAG TPA: VOC family protein [Puia sp.]
MTRNSKIRANYQTVMLYLIVKDAAKFIAFTEKVFDARLASSVMRKKTIMHVEIMIGECTIMLTDATDKYSERPAGIFVYVDLADDTYKKAVASGATTVTEVSDQPYGRSGDVLDLFGITSWITSVK